MRIEKFQFHELSPLFSTVEAAPASAEATTEANQRQDTSQEVTDPPPVEVEMVPLVAVEAAREEGHRTGIEEGKIAGYAEGVEAGKTEKYALDTHVKDVLENIRSELTTVGDAMQSTLLQLEQDTLKLALEIARKVTGSTLEAHAEDIILAMVRKTIPMLAGEPEIVVHVHQDLHEIITEKTDLLGDNSYFGGKVVVKVDEGLALADCRISWNGGEVNRNSAALWKKIEEIYEHVATVPASSVEENNHEEP